MAAAAAVATEPWDLLPRLVCERKAGSLRSAEFCSPEFCVMIEPQMALELKAREPRVPIWKGVSKYGWRQEGLS